MADGDFRVLTDTRFRLNTGAGIPAMGLGTWQSGPEVERAVRHAIAIGYRHIDTAYCYLNEEGVGRGIKAALSSGRIKREDLFVTTKLWCTHHTNVEEALDRSLKNLGLDYVDLYLMHWPLAMNPRGNHPLYPTRPDGSRDIDFGRFHIDTWKDMEKLPATGKTKAIGVCNYSVRFLNQLLPHVDIVPAVNQIENHPLLPQQEIIDMCRARGIHVTAYSPLGSTGSPLLYATPILAVAETRGVPPVSVLLSWHLARGSSVIAKSVNLSRIEDNLFMLKLLDSDMETISKLTADSAARGFHRFIYPPFGVDFGFPDKTRRRY